MTRAVLGVLFALAIVSSARAQDASVAHDMARSMGLDAAKCNATFDARLAEARAAISAQATYAREFARVMPWYFEHCRPLSAVERAVRKLDDPAAFVCDTSKGRPRELTTKFVREHGAELGIEAFQEHAHENVACAALGDPVSLDLIAAPEPDEETNKRAHQLWQAREQQKQIRVTCYGATGERATKCEALQASNARVIAELSRAD